ncbi:hypothetical protein ACFRAE_16945 [Sphingobacterium sp. HJSM2_6]|uniref:hypothetical protein n=1 Tax=Sphingobacterium sp. HJSM2_6 TaxID=3366264 RepID=UPI003BD7CBE6
MENFILSFRCTLKTLLERESLFFKLKEQFPQISMLSVDMDDKQFVLRIQSTQRIEMEIQQYFLELGHRIAFGSVKTIDAIIEKSKTA